MTEDKTLQDAVQEAVKSLARLDKDVQIPESVVDRLIEQFEAAFPTSDLEFHTFLTRVESALRTAETRRAVIRIVATTLTSLARWGILALPS